MFIPKEKGMDRYALIDECEPVKPKRVSGPTLCAIYDLELFPPIHAATTFALCFRPRRLCWCGRWYSRFFFINTETACLQVEHCLQVTRKGRSLLLRPVPGWPRLFHAITRGTLPKGSRSFVCLFVFSGGAQKRFAGEGVGSREGWSRSFHSASFPSFSPPPKEHTDFTLGQILFSFNY